jgi:hypothetical protein
MTNGKALFRGSSQAGGRCGWERACFLTCGLLILLSVDGGAVRAAPALTRLEPPAGQRGTDVEVRISGTELDQPQEIFFEHGSIAVKSVTGESGTVVKATLSIPADCPLGPQRMRVRTADGLSELRMFHVHAAEQVREFICRRGAGWRRSSRRFHSISKCLILILKSSMRMGLRWQPVTTIRS